jgi:hypothetical protein
MSSKSISRLIVLAILLVVQSAPAFYDPNLGRWLSRDPIGEGGFQLISRERVPRSEFGFVVNGEAQESPSAYRFVHNNPLSRVDPLGLDDPSCNAYPQGSILKFVCNNAGSTPWANCVRACLLKDWNPCAQQYNSGAVPIHANCWAQCTINTGSGGSFLPGGGTGGGGGAGSSW